MGERAVVVLGGGVAGSAAALLLARRGHRVTLFERDPMTSGTLTEMVESPRRGVPHYQLPHAFLPGAWLHLRTELPDVADALLANGAKPIDLSAKLPGDLTPEDANLELLAVRRPIIEWALRRSLLAQPGVTIKDNITIRELPEAELVVDAMGRRSPVRALTGAEPDETTDCGVVYYSRYYRLRDGFELPDGPWLWGPRGDLGYLGFTTFPGDNRTFATLLAAPAGVTEWRVLKDAPVYEAAVAQIPGMSMWADPDGVEPITDVMPFAGLRNSIEVASAPHGVIPIGDALVHTDPLLAIGLTLSLRHAIKLTTALDEHDDIADATEAYRAEVVPEARSRFDFASALDAQRYRMWLRQDVDFTRPEDNYELFTMVAASAAALVDPDVFRVFVRRIAALDPTSVLDDDIAMQQRIADIFAPMIAARPPVPSREEFLAKATS